MSTHLHLGSLRLSSPSTGLDLALTSDAHISTLARPCSDAPSITDIESGHVWLAPNTNVKLLLDITWPSSASSHCFNSLRRRLLTALRHAAVSTTFIRSVSMGLTSSNITAMDPVEPSTFPER